MSHRERGIQLQRRENKQKEDGKNQVTNFADFIILPKVFLKHSLGYHGENHVKSKEYPEYETHQIKTMPYAQTPRPFSI